LARKTYQIYGLRLHFYTLYKKLLTFKKAKSDISKAFISKIYKKTSKDASLSECIAVVDENGTMI
jgi:hypothetical protein